jgi:hypothetical protein
MARPFASMPTGNLLERDPLAGINRVFFLCGQPIQLGVCEHGSRAAFKAPGARGEGPAIAAMALTDGLIQRRLTREARWPQRSGKHQAFERPRTRSRGVSDQGNEACQRARSPSLSPKVFEGGPGS